MFPTRLFKAWTGASLSRWASMVVMVFLGGAGVCLAQGQTAQPPSSPAKTRLIGWTSWTLGDISFEAPSSWRVIDEKVSSLNTRANEN